MPKLTKTKAITILLYDTMKLGVRKPTEYFMRVLEINQQELYRPIKYLNDVELIKSYDGSSKGGIERIVDRPLKDVCNEMQISYVDDETLIKECEEVVDATRRLHACDVCNELVPYIDKCNLCMDCVGLTMPEPPKRIARCGHLSINRYFKCESCEPKLQDEEFEYEVGTIQISNASD